MSTFYLGSNSGAAGYLRGDIYEEGKRLHKGDYYFCDGAYPYLGGNLHKP